MDRLPLALAADDERDHARDPRKLRISIAATNPCHVWDLAVELHRLGGLGAYYSGYPKWKLRQSGGMPLRSHSLRTLVTYAMYEKIPERFRPSNQTLFRWQDDGFDRWVARVLNPADFHHGIPGQCREAFRRAKDLGIRTILNHATGPAENLAALLKPEYERVGLPPAGSGGYDAGYLDRVEEESRLADYHCCASSIVRGQLTERGVQEGSVLVLPYGADPAVWHSTGRKSVRRVNDSLKILFAGQLSLRKGLRFLLTALETADRPDWSLDCAGPVLDETRKDRDAYRGRSPVRYLGPLAQADLATRMRESDVLVLPSLEEGFGLVVVQALACGLPCIVSSAVGAKDLIRHRENGSIFTSTDSVSLAEELEYWAGNPRPVSGVWSWREPANRLLAWSEKMLTATHDT